MSASSAPPPSGSPASGERGSGAPDPTLTADLLLDALRATPDTPAFLDSRGRSALSRGDLAARADLVAGGLHALGLRAGETVALAVRPGPAALAVVLACLRLRLRVALVDPAAGSRLVTARLALARPSLLVADAAAQAAAGWAAPLARRAGLDLPRLGDIAPVVTLGRRLPGSAPTLVPAGLGPVPDRRGDDADALVIFTSGTTAAPRAVVHRVASVSAGIDGVRGLVDPSPHRPVVGSTFFVMAPALLAGAPVLLPSRRPSRLAREIAALQPQATYLTPPQARDVLATGAALTGRVFSGSAPVTADLLTRLRRAGASEAWGIYALTEAFPVAAVEAEEKAAYTGPGDLLGCLVGGMRAETSDEGELLLSGPATAHRYLGAEPIERVATGDRGAVSDGRVVLHGRMKDMILRRAENIYPGLHEPALHVPGVDLAVLVGVPSGDGDEEVALLAQPAPGVTDQQVREALRAPLRDMAAARPDHVVVDVVPTSGRSRKPDRAAAAALVAARLGRAPA